MKLLNKTEQISHLQGEDSMITIQDMLTGYRSSPHPATNITPYEALMNRQVRTKLDHQRRDEGTENTQDMLINNKDREYKDKLKRNAENKNTRRHNFIIGDYVLLRQTKRNKWSTAYKPTFYTIYRINGSTIAARRVTDGREICHDASHFKLANAVVQNMEGKLEAGNVESSPEERRESLLSRANPDPDPEPSPEATQEPSQEATQEPKGEDTIPTPETPAPRRTPGINPRPERVKHRPAYLRDYVE